MVKAYDEADVDPALVASCRVAVIGDDIQGYVHALNLTDSGVDVRVGVPDGSSLRADAESAGLRVLTVDQAAAEADLVMMLLPDTEQPEVYGTQVAPHLSGGDALFFVHAFNIRFGHIVPPAGVDVVLVAPRSPSALMRRAYLTGARVPCFVAVEQDASGKARDLALSYAHGIGAARAGVLETTFRDAADIGLFGEHSILCGGLTALALASFETLVEAGYQPELAYFECFHELPLVVDLMHSEGIAGFRYQTSETCAFGDVTRGPRVINDAVRAELKTILAEIQSGAFAEEWLAEKRSGGARFDQLRAAAKDHPLETTRAELGKLLPSLSEKGQHLDAVEAATLATSDARA
jgi:ketol-acid reductoisomerase